MKQFKANNFEQATKELSKLDKDQEGKLKETINYLDRKHYHVIRIEIQTIEGEAKNKVKFNISKHHSNGFEKLKKTFKMMGINRLIILHDPTKLNEKETPTVPAHQKESIEARVRREMKEQHDSEIKQKVSEGIADALKEKEDLESTGDEKSKTELFYEGYETVMKKSATVEMIVAFASEYEIELGEGNKADKQAVIEEWFKNLPQTKA